MSGYISVPPGISDFVYQNISIINQQVVNIISQMNRTDAEREITGRLFANNFNNPFYNEVVKKVCDFFEYGLAVGIPVNNMINNELATIVRGIYGKAIVSDYGLLRLAQNNAQVYHGFAAQYQQLVNTVNSFIDQQTRMQQQYQPQGNNGGFYTPPPANPPYPQSNQVGYNNYNQQPNYAPNQPNIPRQPARHYTNNQSHVTVERGVWESGNESAVGRYRTSSIPANNTTLKEERPVMEQPQTAPTQTIKPIEKAPFAFNNYLDFIKTRYKFPYNNPLAMIEPKAMGYTFDQDGNIVDSFVFEESTMEFKHHDLSKFFEPEFKSDKDTPADPAATRRVIAKMQQQITYEGLLAKFTKQREGVEADSFNYEKMVTLNTPIAGDYPGSPLSYLSLLQQSSDYQDLFEIEALDIYQTVINFNVVNYTGIFFDDTVAKLAALYTEAKTMGELALVMNKLLDNEYESVVEVVRLQNRIVTRLINHILVNILDIRVQIDSFSLDVIELEKLLATKYDMKGALDGYAEQLAKSLFKPVGRGNRYVEFMLTENDDESYFPGNTFLFVSNVVLLPINSSAISFSGSQNRAFLSKVPGQDNVLYDAINTWYCQREDIAYRSLIVTLDNRIIEVMPARMKGTYLLVESKL